MPMGLVANAPSTTYETLHARGSAIPSCGGVKGLSWMGWAKRPAPIASRFRVLSQGSTVLSPWRVLWRVLRS